MAQNKIDKYLNAFILIGMMLTVTLVTAMKVQDAGNGGVGLLLVAAAGTVMGVLNSVLSANGNIWAFLFGFLDVVLCSIVYFENGVMGTFAMHVLYFLPMQFVGLWQWSKRGASVKADESGEVSKVKARKLTGVQWLCLLGSFIAGTALCYGILHAVDAARLRGGEIAYIDDQKILLDASVVVLNIIGQALMSMAFMEQWYVWTFVNVFSILLWTDRLLNPEAGASTLVMVVKYSFYLLNSLNGIRIWLRLSRKG